MEGWKPASKPSLFWNLEPALREVSREGLDLFFISPFDTLSMK